MPLHIRQETLDDHQNVFELIKAAFEGEEFSDQTEHYLVERLRKSEVFIPELSLVAELKGEIVGHILFTKIIIQNGEEEFESLALAPVSVLPEYQGKGIGGALIIKGHELAKELGYRSALVLGHAEYYPKFGYRQSSEFGIAQPFGAPDENNMAIELVEGGLNGVSGVAVYSEEFYSS